MESYQPVPPSFNSSNLNAEPAKLKKPNPVVTNSENNITEITTAKTPEGCIGFLDVFLHEARDIHNICIYHKQDVYAKLYLTNDAKSAISTQIINGGGRNPVFNQNLWLTVQNIDASLKCEIWMLSRVKNYLEDQLLGLALMPLSDAIMANGMLQQEFSLSSNDLFHSPAGFVRLSISYTGSLLEVLSMTPRENVSLVDKNDECELDKIEFPDLNIVNENKMMVSEYFGVPCTNLDSQCDEDNNDEAGVRVVESLAKTSPDSDDILKSDTPLDNVSTNGSPNGKDNSTEGKTESFVPPVISINFEPKQSVVQQEIVDMYMKSMQQFTESLANMELPMDFESNSCNISSSTTTTTENGGSDPNFRESNKTGSRVFMAAGHSFDDMLLFRNVSRKMIMLRTSDGEVFEVEEAIAAKSQTILHLIEDDCADDVIPLPNVKGHILSKIIEYCKKHIESSANDDDLRSWDAEFMKVDTNVLYDLLQAANFLNIKDLLHLACQTVADKIKGKTPEEIRETFGIENDFTPEEEKKIREEHSWAFE